VAGVSWFARPRYRRQLASSSGSTSLTPAALTGRRSLAKKHWGVRARETPHGLRQDGARLVQVLLRVADDSAGLQRGQRVGVIAEFGEHLDGVLAEFWSQLVLGASRI
jgi:hypothetical protein